MLSKKDLDTFLSHKTLVLYGASRKKDKFGNTVLRELLQKGYTVYPIHREATELEQVSCFKSLSELPAHPGGAVLIIPPNQTNQVVKELLAADIKRVWMQSGAESDAAIAFCQKNNMQVISDACILMFTEPLGLPHRLHRWFWKLFGKLPK